MTGKFTKLLPISDSELPRCLSMSCLFFLLMFGWGLGDAGRGSYFITIVGPDKLPIMYILKAVMVIVVAAAYFQLVDRLSRYAFFVALLLTFSVTLICLTAIIPLGFHWIPYALYGLSEIFLETLILMHFWTVANDIFDPREGRRIFPIIGGIGLIGMILGGAVTIPIVSVVGTRNLLLLWAIFVIFLIPVIYWIRAAAQSAGIPATAGKIENGNEGSTPVTSYSALWSIPLVRAMAYVSFPTWMVVYFVDYQFFVTMHEITRDQDQLTGLLGILNSFIALAGLILHLFVTPRVLSSVGVGSALMIHPVLMTLSAVGLSCRSVFTPAPSSSIFSFRSLAAISARFTDETMATSTGHSALELLFNAVPKEHRAQSRAFIAGAVAPVCTIIAGFVLMLLLMFHISDVVISVILLLLCGLWILATSKLKSEYLQGLVTSLQSHSRDLRDSAASELSNLKDSSTIQILLDLLASRDDEVALFALEMLDKIGYAGLNTRLCDVLPETSPKLTVEILTMLSDSADSTLIPSIRPLLNSSETEVVAAAVRAIAKIGSDDDLDVLKPYLDSPEMDVLAEAVIAFIQVQPNRQEHDRALAILRGMVNAEDPNSRAKAAYIIGEVHAKKLVQLLTMLAESEEETVQLAVVKASGKTDDEEIVPPLTKFFESDRLRHHVIDAIIHLDDVAVEPLQHLLMIPMLNEKVKEQMLYCLGKIGNPKSLTSLIEFLKLPGISVRIKVAAATALVTIMRKMKKKAKECQGSKRGKVLSNGGLNQVSSFLKEEIRNLQTEKTYVYTMEAEKDQNSVYLLSDALSRVCDQRLELILRYLELIDDPKIIRTAAVNLKDRDPRSRAEALEILDGMTAEARELVRVLEKDNLTLAEREIIGDRNDTLRELLDYSQNLWVHACTIYAIGDLKLSEFESDLLELKDKQGVTESLTDSSLFYALSTSERRINREPMVLNNINLALHKLGTEINENSELKEIEKMSLNMGRMLFLRRVPLFVNLEGSDLQFLSEICIEKEYAAGHVIFEEADDGDALYIIESGRVNIVTGKDENAVILGVLEERECFGEMSILDGESRSASANVAKDSKVLVINREDFHGILLARPRIAITLFRTLSLRFRATLSQLTVGQRKEVFLRTALD